MTAHTPQTSFPVRAFYSHRILWLVVALLAPGLSLLVFGNRLDKRVEELLLSDRPQNSIEKSPNVSKSNLAEHPLGNRRRMLLLATMGVLAADIFLPVPSSLVATLAGKELGPVIATGAAWFGLTLGGILGFALARWLGGAAARLSTQDDLASARAWANTAGPASIILLRPAPLLAEASVLAAGLGGMDWRKFLPALLLGNLAATLPYTLFGHWVGSNPWLPWALAVAALSPLALTWLLRRRLGVQASAKTSATGSP